jgi:hypothetical protein
LAGVPMNPERNSLTILKHPLQSPASVSGTKFRNHSPTLINLQQYLARGL